jgi:hypothetical protein
MKTHTGKKRKRRLVAYGDQSVAASCRTKLPAKFPGIFTFFRSISKFLLIYSTISRGTPNVVLWNPKVPRNPGWQKRSAAIVLKL